ncbi:hypothetical protein AB0H88_19610 [Nonomuraea sp. NPDC050680]|uniref:hypothetical protein n=1 Tax=Nonomuraea sp. NPDC050680 TaxID=3154630 RepID=UPI0033FA35BF
MGALREIPPRSGRTRAAVLLPAAAVAFVVLIGSGVPARAADGAAAPAAEVMRSGVPKGFLLYESKTTRKKFEKKIGRMSWKFSDRRSAPLLINPCGVEKRADKDRQAARTITGRSVMWDGDYAEQLIVYQDEMAASTAIKSLRSELRRCGKRNRDSFTFTTRPAHIGDEAFLVNVFQVASAMTGTVMRQGRSLAVYALPYYRKNWRESDYGGSQARIMARKLSASSLGR